jgi:hypothetical protein
MKVQTGFILVRTDLMTYFSNNFTLDFREGVSEFLDRRLLKKSNKNYVLFYSMIFNLCNGNIILVEELYLLGCNAMLLLFNNIIIMTNVSGLKFPPWTVLIC